MFGKNKRNNNEVAVRTDNGQPDPILTRQFLEEYVAKQLVAINAKLIEARHECHYAWYRTMETGEKVGFIMYGDPSGSGYVDVEGIFSFVEATNGNIGPHVSAILTPSTEAEAEFKKLNDEAEHDYNCSGGSHYWVVPNARLKIGRADAFRLLGNLPKAGSSK